MLVIFDGARLRKERKRQGLSQARLAVQMDSSIRHVQALENGEKRNPSAALVCKAARALDVPMETLMQIWSAEGDEGI